MRLLSASTVAFGALAATVLTAAPVQAQRYVPPGTVSQDCQQSLNNNRLAGAVVGAGLGALAGSNVASRGRRSEGAVLGAVVGALAGREVGGRRLACDDAVYNQDRRSAGFRQPNYGYNQGGYYQGGYNQGHVYRQPAHDPYARPDYGYGQTYQTSYVPPRSYQNSCGWGQAQYTTPDGRVSRQDVWMCLDRGVWVVQQ